MPNKPSKRKILYAQRKKSGCCPRCGGKVKKTSKFIFCDDCRAFFRGYNHEYSESINEARKAKYDDRKESGQCPRCGKKLGKGYNRAICPDCLDKQYQYNYAKKRPVKKPVAAKKPVKKGKKK
ncbi:MAG: hypothetical protein LBI28_06765 [Treponema sp.]|jgi:Zn finger protein HypA/HybF involved in hydrogenase expression|nr:hypothetical protein [Treponema sp.]